MPTLTYFDFPGGRGEDCRLAMHIAGVPFTDDRVRGDWPARKPLTPYRSLPTLEVEGKGVLGQSNAILTYIGRSHGLHPSDPWEAARHESILASAEDLRHLVSATFALSDDDKKATRQALASGGIQEWAAKMEDQIRHTPFLAGEQISVADLKLFVLLNWFTSGALDHIPADVMTPHEKLTALHAAVAAHPDVVTWYAR